MLSPAAFVWLATASRTFIQPQALTAMLRILGFQQIVDLTQQEQPLPGTHLVSAMV